MLSHDHTIGRGAWTGPGRRGLRTYQFPSRLLFFIILGFWLSGFAYSAAGLPDYDSYQVIYQSLDLGWGPLFLALNYLGTWLHMDYSEFRQAILLLSLTGFCWALLVFLRNSRISNPVRINRKFFFNIGTILIGSVALPVFLLEFFVIRIRSGLSLAIVSLAFAISFNTRCKAKKSSTLAAIALLALAYGIHGFATATAAYLLFSPLLFAAIYFRKSSIVPGYFFRALALAAILAGSIIVVAVIGVAHEERGANLDSPLNSARLGALSALPVLIFVVNRVRRWGVDVIGHPRKTSPEVRQKGPELPSINGVCSCGSISPPSHIFLWLWSFSCPMKAVCSTTRVKRLSVYSR